MPPPPLLWLTLAAALLLAVLAGLESDGLLLVGGLVALLLVPLAATAWIPLPGQLLLFVAAVGMLYPPLQRWSRRQGEGRIPPGARASTAEVIAPFDAQGEGRVRWQGQSWAARNLDPERPVAPGATVTVMGREGNQLQVLPPGHDLAGAP
jgi:membrane protein implicated in regulation of membrane protease activity